MACATSWTFPRMTCTSACRWLSGAARKSRHCNGRWHDCGATVEMGCAIRPACSDRRGSRWSTARLGSICSERGLTMRTVLLLCAWLAGPACLAEVKLEINGTDYRTIRDILVAYKNSPERRLQAVETGGRLAQS